MSRLFWTTYQFASFLNNDVKLAEGRGAGSVLCPNTTAPTRPPAGSCTAKMVAQSWDGLRTSQTAEAIGRHLETARTRLHAFNKRRVEGQT